MKPLYILVALSVAGLQAGCAHSMMRGSVAMKMGADEAHVCMGDNEVKAGDTVTLYKNACTSTKTGGKSAVGDPTGCKKVKLGEGTVERTLNAHYSLVKVNPGVSFEEGNVVEKN